MNPEKCAALTTLALAACMPLTAVPHVREVALASRFDPEEIAWANRRGNNKIAGTALLRTVGGEVRTCAAYPATLTPASGYAAERMNYLYGNTRKGYNPIDGGKNVVFVHACAECASDEKEYVRTTRETICDAQGKFEFEDIPNGVYFLTVPVVWQVTPYSREGGYLMQRVRVEAGRTEKVVLTAQ
jgi:hypothetical protein